MKRPDPVVLPIGEAEDREPAIAALTEIAQGLSLSEQWEISFGKQTRSAKQNAYLWGVCYRMIAEFIRFNKEGCEHYTAEGVHEHLKKLFMPCRIEVHRHSEQVIYKSTTELSQDEFTEYWESIQRWAAEFGCVIPDPDPDYVRKKRKRK